MHLINFVHDPPVTVNTLGDKYSISVENASKLRAVHRGTGAFVFYHTPHPSAGRSGSMNSPAAWNTELVMTEEATVELLLLSKAVVQFALPDPSPCTGMMTADMDGFIVAPTIRLHMSDGRDVAIVLLSPRKQLAKIDIEKTTLSISSDKLNATVFIAADDSLHCTGTVSGRGFKTAKLLLTRKPNCPTIQRGFVEKIAEIRGAGQMNATWKPVSKNYEDTLAIFRPDDVKDYDLEQVANRIGSDDDAFMGENKSSFLIGDGNGTSYKLTLILDRFLRRQLSDETTITVS